MTSKKLGVAIPVLVVLALMNIACVSTSPQVGKEKATIIYVYDPMCGWCYGFTNTIDSIASKYKDDFKFEVIAGGLIFDSIPISNFENYITENHEYFEEETGVAYGKSFMDSTLKDNSVYTRSLEPAMAIHIIQEANPERAVEFLVTVQRAIFHDGIHPMNPNAYLPYIKGYNITEQAFLTKMKSDEYRRKINQGYIKASEMGVDGYPVLILNQQGKTKKLISGHMPFDKVDKKVGKEAGK